MHMFLSSKRSRARKRDGGRTRQWSVAMLTKHRAHAVAMRNAAALSRQRLPVGLATASAVTLQPDATRR